MNDIFNHILFINMDKHLERCLDTRLKLDSYFHGAYPVERVPGPAPTYDEIKYRVGYRFKNPTTGRNPTLGEVGCAMAHIAAWKRVVELGVPCLILEDDIEADADTVAKDIRRMGTDAMAGRTWDLMYLGRQPHFPELETWFSPYVKVARYSWLTHAYVLTPEGAAKLLATHFENLLFAVDDYIPAMYGDGIDAIQDEFAGYPKLIAVASMKTLFHQIDVIGETRTANSETESSPIIYSPGKDPNERKYTVVTVASDTEHPGFVNLLTTARNNAWNYMVNAYDPAEGWKGGDMTGPGGGHKLTYMLRMAERCPDPDGILIFVDGYDVLFNDTPLAVIRDWLENFDEDKVLFAAEKHEWPTPGLTDEEMIRGTSPYLNSGCYIGKAKHIIRVLRLAIRGMGVDVESEDDQLALQCEWWLELRANNPLKSYMDVDTESVIFQCLSDVEGIIAGDITVDDDGTLWNHETGTKPLIVHGNGGPASKRAYSRLADIYIAPQWWVGPKTLL